MAIEVIDDGLFEEEMEQFTVILSTSDDVDISSQRNTATVIIIDNEGTVLCPPDNTWNYSETPRSRTPLK